MVGTSTGLYSTETLNGASTTWMQESAADLGNSVVEYLHARFDDAALFVGTHGRGVYKGRYQGVLTSPGPPASPKGLQITATESEVNLIWAANTERDITGYNIYKGDQPRSMTLLGSSQNTSFTEANAEFKPIYYSITATDNEGNESTLSRPVAAFRDFRDIDTEWRLLGSPMSSASAVSVPGTAQIVAFNGVYEPTSQLQQATGYWIKNTQADSIIFTGSAPTEATLSLEEGWNLISGVSDTVLVSNIIDMNGTLDATPVKRFVSGAYQDATQINPGEGYFVYAQQDGDITLQVDTSAAATTQAPPRREKEIITESYDKLIFESKNRSQVLYVSGSSVPATQLQNFRMPPVAPGKVLDVRTDKGFNIADTPGTRIRLNTPEYPVRISLAEAKATGIEKQEKETTYRLIASDGAEKIYLDISAGEPVMLRKSYQSLVLEGMGGEEIPLTNALFPNYPNPFNPTTTIRYQISSQSQVKLEMYNLLGRKVGTYVNQVQQPGIYTISVDGANLSSGTYFMRIQAGEFSQIQKMTLIK
jgi:hypothetical protein